MPHVSARRDKLERGLLLGVAPLSIALAAAVLLGPGGARPAPFARVYGAPFGRRVALRVATGTSLFGVEAPYEVKQLSLVEPRSSGDVVRWQGASGADGVAEGWFDADPGRASVDVAVLANGRRLAAGVVRLDARHDPTPVTPAIDGPRTGVLGVTARVRGGALAVPFRGKLEVHVVGSAGRASSDSTVSVDAPGADVAPAQQPTNPDGDATFVVTPRAHTIDVVVTATSGGESGSLTGHLPVVPGAMAIERRDGTAEVVAPSPREAAYVSFWGPHGRVAGQIVRLRSRADGFFTGLLEPLDPSLAAAPRRAGADPSSALDLAAPELVTVAGDPLELGVATVTWQVFDDDARRFVPPKLELSFDGLDAALEAESSRAWRARRAALYVVGAAAAVVIALILGRGRRAQRGLEAHLAEDGVEALRAAHGESPLWSFLSVAIVALAFSIIAAFATFR